MNEADAVALRQAMVRRIEEVAVETAFLTGRRTISRRVLDAMLAVPRHRFVPPAMEPMAYEDTALPIGQGQTISQPFIVALMTDLLDLRPDSRVLEIGTGSGYQAAVLAQLVAEVYSVETVPELARAARMRLDEAGVANVQLREGDGGRGWPEGAPFDRIVVTAAAEALPPALADQLVPGGVMVAPVGLSRFAQDLMLYRKSVDNELSEQPVLPVAFVPLVRPSAPTPSG